MMLWSYFRQTSWYTNHPLYHSRPIVCSSGDSGHLSFLCPCLLFVLSCAFVFPCLTLTILISFFPPCLPLCPFFVFPGSTLFSFFGLLVTFTLRPPVLCDYHLADVAHHRTQHALNKPSNPKTPQGTNLSAQNVASPLCHPALDAHCHHL